jgi:hypothetical protein
VIPDIRETGTMPKRKERGSELSWAVPDDNEQVTGLRIVAWPLEDGAPKKDWRPGTDTVQDIRPGSVQTRNTKIASASPTISRAQEGQRSIAVHALENLGTSDTGITTLRYLLREQIKRVEEGLDPMNVMRDAWANQKIPTNAWNTIMSPAEASVFQASEA